MEIPSPLSLRLYRILFVELRIFAIPIATDILYPGDRNLSRHFDRRTVLLAQAKLGQERP